MALSRSPLLQPRWIVAHLVVLAVVVTFPLLGLWQLRRWHEETDRADRLAVRLQAPPVPLTSVLHEGLSAEQRHDLEYTPVVAQGTYLADEQVFHRNRDFEGLGGFDALTPLALGDGAGVLVRRGFVPPDVPGGVDPAAAPVPDGPVEVVGYLEAPQEPASGFSAVFAPSDPTTGTLDTVFVADIERLQRQTSVDLLPMVLHLTRQDPPHPVEGPLPQPRPDVDTTQNLSYAGQWFAFTAIAVIGYAVVLYRTHRRRM